MITIVCIKTFFKLSFDGMIKSLCTYLTEMLSSSQTNLSCDMMGWFRHSSLNRFIPFGYSTTLSMTLQLYASPIPAIAGSGENSKTNDAIRTQTFSLKTTLFTQIFHSNEWLIGKQIASNLAIVPIKGEPPIFRLMGCIKSCDWIVDVWSCDILSI